MLASDYQNPVYAGSCPDPFVLKYCGEYWAYCTGSWHDGRCFGVLRSRDLVRWQVLDGALAPLPGDHPCYWAPEVVYDNGQFYLYYSVGDEARMQLRVAVADHPAGPFADSGHVLTHEPFAIDAHVFVDDDGARYLFYATDFLNHRQIGTGTVRARLRDPFSLAEAPQPVTLPRYDWQVYDPQRIAKGGVRWHTVEGSFVLKHKRRYYQMFSGGNWQNTSYGVAYATTTRLDAPGEWQQLIDGEQRLPILRSIPGRVIGPGHNSVVRGPDNRQLFCVYHRWEQQGSLRQLALDPLDWAGERMLVVGPSETPQPLDPPTLYDYFDQAQPELGLGWHCRSGRWSAQNGVAQQHNADGLAEAVCSQHGSHFRAEVSLRALDGAQPTAALGASLLYQGSAVLRAAVLPHAQALRVEWRRGEQWQLQAMALPTGFVPSAFHLLRCDLDGARVQISLDEVAARWQGQLDAPPDQIALLAHDTPAAFAGFALTLGWHDLFDEPHDDPKAVGWQPLGEAQGWRVAEQALRARAGQAHAVIVKGPLLRDYSLAVSAQLVTHEDQGCYGLYPARGTDQAGLLLTVERQGAGWALVWRDGASAGRQALPPGFDPQQPQQLRLRKQAGRLAVAWEATPLLELPVADAPARVGLYAHQAAVAFHEARVTALQPMQPRSGHDGV
jgi:GH43 family beta-xylosidase